MGLDLIGQQAKTKKTPGSSKAKTKNAPGSRLDWSAKPKLKKHLGLGWIGQHGLAH